MKTLLVTLIALISMNTFSAVTPSLHYNCEMDDVRRQGTVSIEENRIVGNPSCMFFPKAEVCFRFERRLLVDDVHFAVRRSSHLNMSAYNDYISLSNIPFSEGAKAEYLVKTGLKKRLLTCTFDSVIW